MDSETKAYIDGKVGELRKELRDFRKEMAENVIEPLSSNMPAIAALIEKHEEISGRIDKIEQESGTIDQGTASGDLPSLKEIMDESLNMMAIPFIESMKFVVMISSLVEKKSDPMHIKDKIVNDYGNVLGRLYLETLNDVIQQTSKKNIKKACSDVLDLMRGAQSTSADDGEDE